MSSKKEKKTAASDVAFRFSPRPNSAGQIAWQPWGEEAFLRAKQEKKPLLLAISAVWCHWCHVMDETGYSDEEVIALINESFIPLRVDSDQRPDINQRYNQGGWPTTAFLTDDGEVITGTTYIPPDQFKRLLVDVRDLYANNLDEIRLAINNIREQREAAVVSPPEGPPPGPSVAAYLLEVAGDVYDREYGGFGSTTKFPYANVISLILSILAEGRIEELEKMLTTTLDAMSAGGMYDQVEGGFFRYSTDREWTTPHYEKMLEDNAALLGAYIEAAHVTGLKEYEAVARDIYRYLTSVLLDPESGAFRGSQDADEEYYQLDASGREKAGRPYVDPTIISGWNATAASALIRGFQLMGDPEYRDRAIAALEFVWEKMWEPSSGLSHYYSNGTAYLPGMLSDAARMLNACLDAYESGTGEIWLDRSLKLAQWLLANLADEKSGGFYDCMTPPGQAGLPAERTVPLVENSIAATALIRLAQNSGQPRFGEAAAQALNRFSGNYKESGLFAADYAIAVERLLDPPVRVTITGPPGENETLELIRAAHMARIPFRSVEVLDPAVHNEELEATGYGYADKPVAYICIGASCQPPVTDPAELPGRLEAGRIR
ncbi:MAG: thioredoxin domain-containing protein [Actinobacteria bacterium]|nr:thioredoxin domain-containing protein [Actinomycetota bacterium]